MDPKPKSPSDPAPKPEPPTSSQRRGWRRWLPWAIFALVILLALTLHHCSTEPTPIPAPPSSGSGLGSKASPMDSDTVSARKMGEPSESSQAREAKKNRPRLSPTLRPGPISAVGKSDSMAGNIAAGDSLPYVVADPWGGRHFDSVRVALRCREDCVILYSLEDSVNMRTYETPFTFRRNATLWFSGVSTRGERTPPVRLDYVIEKNPGHCAPGSMPIRSGSAEVCVDIYEWPNREGAIPASMINQREAEDSCQHAGKRLCREDEWREACQGPDRSDYPYGNRYDPRYCASQQREASRSGRLPACRSYYGLYDLTGNLWEWTESPDPNHEDFFFVAGGNWEGAEKGTCSLAKYSFFPQNRYPGVGFRCCEPAK